jgi:hypothetical protein
MNWVGERHRLLKVSLKIVTVQCGRARSHVLAGVNSASEGLSETAQ